MTLARKPPKVVYVAATNARRNAEIRLRQTEHLVEDQFAGVEHDRRKQHAQAHRDDPGENLALAAVLLAHGVAQGIAALEPAQLGGDEQADA